MPRPKGSKNKKTLEAEARLGEDISEQKKIKRRLENERDVLVNEIEERENRLKSVKKDLRVVTKNIEYLIEKQKAANARVVEAANEQELVCVVTALIKGGLSSEDILDKLQ